MNTKMHSASEPWVLSVLHFRRPRIVLFDGNSLGIAGRKFSHIDVINLDTEYPWLISKILGVCTLRITIATQNSNLEYSLSLFKKDAITFSKKIKRAIEITLSIHLIQIEEFTKPLLKRHSLAYRDHTYIRSSIAKKFSKSEENSFSKYILCAQMLAKNTMLSKSGRERLSSAIKALLSIENCIQNPKLARHEHNQTYASEWKEKAKGYFMTVESSPLTDEQIQAALVFEDATLVIAAAGSGKTSCIVGKIGFALKTGLFDESQILALAYNKKAAIDLQARLNEKLEKALGYPVSVASKTFHSYGLATLLAHHGEGYEPKVLKEEGNEENRFMKQVISELTRGNKTFQKALSLWVSFAPYEDPQPIGVTGNLEECAKRYEDCCLKRLQIRRDSHKKPWEPTIPTLRQDVHVRSLEERGIANWLILHDVPFKYEQPDWEGARRLRLGVHKSGKPKPYNPDFTYSYTEELSNGQKRTVRVVHEHFALDVAGRAPEWLGGIEYEQHADNKRDMYYSWMLEKPNRNERIIFIETTSAMVRDGSIWKHLKRALTKAGIQVKKPNQEIHNRALEHFRETSNLEQLIIDFVLRYKESGLSESAILGKAKISSNAYRSKLFLDVALLVFNAYQQALKKAEKIDFTDMLCEAIRVLSDSQTQSPYRFILVDEFQDISKLKADLVKSTLAKNPNESIVFFVGDDWQTINRFTGSDIDIFTNVSKYFGRTTSRLKLTETFRSSQGIADIAKHLVMLNSNQLIKEVKAKPDRVSGAVRIVYHIDNARGRQETLRAELNNIVNTAQKLGLKHPTVQILRRTQHDSTVPEGAQTDFLKSLVKDYKDILGIELYTMHKAKGLEADFVILIGLDSGFRGFPHERPIETLPDLVLPFLKNPTEEERRLMYVALTRAKNMVSLLVASKRPSEFILELETNKKNLPAISWIPCPSESRIACPKCKYGSLSPATESSINLICSRTMACGYIDKKN